MGLATHAAPSNRQHTSISQEPFPGGMVAVQLTAPQTELQGLAGKALPAPALPARRKKEGRALICNGSGGMQCPLPTHSQAPVGGAGNGFEGSISPSCVSVCWCRKCRLLGAASWPAPGRGRAGSSTSQPLLCTLLPKVCWRAQPAPWHGWLQPNNIRGLAPATTPFPGSPFPFTPHHKQCLLPDQLHAVCFWQQLRKD